MILRRAVSDLNASKLKLDPQAAGPALLYRNQFVLKF